MGICTTVRLRDGRTFAVMCDQAEVTIGRNCANDVALMNRFVSKRHSRIVLRDGKLIIVDLKSSNGTFVNGKRISSPQVLKDGDKIYIADFTLTVDTKPVAGAGAPYDAPAWAGADSDDAATEIIGSPAQAPRPPAGDDDERTPPVGMAPSPPGRPTSKNDEPALLLRDEVSGRVHMVTRFGMSIGRNAPSRGSTPAPGILVDSPSVSLQHARVTFDGTRFQLGDLNSAQGTFLVDSAGGTQRVQGASTARLTTGARIRFGEITFIVLEASTMQKAMIALRALETKLEEERRNKPAATSGPASTRATTTSSPVKGKVVIDDGDALGVAPAGASSVASKPRPTFSVSVGGVSIGDVVRDDGLVRVSRGRASGRDARITQLSENLRGDDEFEAMFRDMVKLVSLFQSPRLPRMLASDPDLLATSPPPGTSLAELLERHGHIPQNVAVYIAIECARVLADFHDVKNDTGAPLHPVLRKLTPETVEIARDGSVHIAELLIVKADATWRETETKAGVIKGDFFTMSPEQARAQPLDARSDVWALGVLLHTMIEGKNPFRASSSSSDFEALERIIAGKVPPLRDASDALHDAVSTLLTPDRNARPASARDAIAVLERVALTLPPASRLDVERLVR